MRQVDYYKNLIVIRKIDDVPLPKCSNTYPILNQISNNMTTSNIQSGLANIINGADQWKIWLNTQNAVKDA
jgi:hypothetical protein|tara:strand:+ start:171 stop:383 length:213 start_codon:yes stop_codon:yes gene_type:complete